MQSHEVLKHTQMNVLSATFCTHELRAHDWIVSVVDRGERVCSFVLLDYQPQKAAALSGF